MSRTNVVVTGLGVATAGACSPDVLFEQVKLGKSFVTVSRRLSALGFSNPVVATLSQRVWDKVNSHAMIGEHDTPFTNLTLFTAQQAITHSNIHLSPYDRRAGVFMACNRMHIDAADLADLIGAVDKNGVVNLDSLNRKLRQYGGRRRQSRRDHSALIMSEQFGFADLVMTSSDACAASTIAIGTAYRYICNGELDVAIAGGTELPCEPVVLVGFTAIGMIANQKHMHPSTMCRPFDRDRCGMVLGDGSAFLVLESAEHAQARGAKPLARIAGFAKYSEAGNLLSSTPDGSEFARSMRGALADANMQPEDIDHISAHGTATAQNDACESLAIQQVFGSRTKDIPVTANKSVIGHTIGASGAVQAVLAVLSLQHGILLPTLNYDTPDDSIPYLDVVTKPREARLRTVMSNSFGMGGENCSLILETA